jgi:hypothetical protein
MITLNDYREHIADLLACHGIYCEYKVWGCGEANIARRTIRIPPITDARAYSIALHEIGHILTDESDQEMTREIDAWEWARDHALTWNRKMQHMASLGLRSHLEHALTDEPFDQRVWEWVDGTLIPQRGRDLIVEINAMIAADNAREREVTPSH